LAETEESKNSLRQRAEREFGERNRELSLPAEREDIARLVHELQVHQIELELQKEELLRVQEQLQKSNERYRDLYDYAPVGYFTLNSAYKITGVNLAGAQLLKEPRSKLINTRFTRFIASGETDRFHFYFKQVSSSDHKLVLELEMQRTDKTTFYARLEGLKAESWELRLALTDITERKQAEEAIKKSEQKYKDIVETANEGILIGATDGRILYANQRMADLFGYALSEIMGELGLEFMPSDQRDLVLRTRKELESGKKLRREFKFRRKDGSILWTLASITPQFNGYGHHTTNLVMHTDITEIKKAEEALARAKEELEIKVNERTEQLQGAFNEIMQSQKELKEANNQLKQYAKKITQVQEEERKRIAYELHDDTAQYLSILKMQIGALANSGEIKNPKVKEKLQFLEQDADRAFNDVRRYSHELRPTTLEHQGLVGALEQIADDFNKLGQLAVEVHIEGIEPELSEEVKLGFFRIAQEALNNARKHAKASQVNIDIRFNHKQLQMGVSDNGIGFELPKSAARSKGTGSLGLLSMKERADLINADLKIESEPGKGTKVILKAKL
jgi:PAS domain S-box-containing protein